MHFFFCLNELKWHVFIVIWPINNFVLTTDEVTEVFGYLNSISAKSMLRSDQASVFVFNISILEWVCIFTDLSIKFVDLLINLFAGTKFCTVWQTSLSYLSCFT